MDSRILYKGAIKYTDGCKQLSCIRKGRHTKTDVEDCTKTSKVRKACEDKAKVSSSKGKFINPAQGALLTNNSDSKHPV